MYYSPCIKFCFLLYLQEFETRHSCHKWKVISWTVDKVCVECFGILESVEMCSPLLSKAGTESGNMSTVRYVHNKARRNVMQCRAHK
jgi:hypothetical protein